VPLPASAVACGKVSDMVLPSAAGLTGLVCSACLIIFVVNRLTNTRVAHSFGKLNKETANFSTSGRYYRATWLNA
jgi:hypothetical protein